MLSWPSCGRPALVARRPNQKTEKLMVFLLTADGFRNAVSALRSLDGGDGVRFHNFTLCAASGKEPC